MLRWWLKSISCLVVGGVLGGCSIHPIPDDVSTHTTPQIVNNIRCEVKEQVRLRLQELIDESAHPQVRQIRAERVLRPAELATLKRFAPEIATKITKYQTMTIAYSFEFDIKERNHNHAGATLSWPLSNPSGTFNLGAKGTANFNRDARRTFAITDSFDELELLKCRDATIQAQNFVYPITGSIGARNIIDAYLELGKAGATGEAGPFRDEISFTTEIGGDITPTLTLAPVPNKFRVIDAHGSFEANRRDFHKVTIVITFPTIDDRVPQNGPLTRQQIQIGRINSAQVAADELCILKQRRELREQIEALPPGSVFVNATQDPPLLYCNNARLR
jgi:hypothetical protein